MKVLKYLAGYSYAQIPFEDTCFRQIEELETDSLEMFRNVMKHSKVIKKVYLVSHCYETNEEITAILN